MPTNVKTDDPKARWWIWAPLGAAIAFAGYGMAIHDRNTAASNARKICEALVTTGSATQQQCDKNHADSMKDAATYILDKLSSSPMLTTP